MIETDVVFNFQGINSLKKFINKKIYEPFLKDLLVQFPNFKNGLSIIENQSNSENDFKDLTTGKKYEATLLINDGTISKIIKNRYYILSDEFYNQRQNDTISLFIDSLKRKRKKKVTIILFNIFPDIFCKFQNSVTEKYFYDETDQIFERILTENEGIIRDKEILIVSYNDDNSFYIRTLYPRKNDLYFIEEYNRDSFPFNIISKKSRLT